MEPREPEKQINLGATGTGKSYNLIQFFEKQLTSKNPRNVIIYDMNDEFKEFKTISLEDIPKFNINKFKEIRRIGPLSPSGEEYSKIEKFERLKLLVGKYKPYNSYLLVEDPDNYTNSSQGATFADFMTVNRHKGLDVFIAYQSWGAPPTQIWRNIDIIELHRCIDSPMKSKIRNEFSDVKILILAHHIVEQLLKDNQYANIRIHKSKSKLYGNFTQQHFITACIKYMAGSTDGKKELKETIAIEKCSEKAAKQKIINKLANIYL